MSNVTSREKTWKHHFSWDSHPFLQRCALCPGHGQIRLYEWVMSHIEWVTSHTGHGQIRLYEWVMSHIEWVTSHHRNKTGRHHFSWDLQRCALCPRRILTYDWVVSHILMSNVTPQEKDWKASLFFFEELTSILIKHVLFVFSKFVISDDWVMSHYQTSPDTIWMSHGTHINESRHMTGRRLEGITFRRTRALTPQGHSVCPEQIRRFRSHQNEHLLVFPRSAR